VRVLATYNIKGGVGKTASAVNLSYLAARSGYRTLIWDLDPQGAASFYYRVKPRIKGGGKKLVRGDLELDSRIKATDF
jgi:cellulose biosynthesis protein BcsQ